MKAQTKIRLSLLGILLLTVLAGLVSWPSGPTVPGRDVVKVNLGLDMQGGVALLYQADVSQVPEEDRLTQLNTTRELLETRVNPDGTLEPVIQTVRSGDEYRLSIELPGVSDINEAIRRIGETPKLEFKVEAEPPQRSEEEKQEIRDRNEQKKSDAEEVLKKAQQPDAKFAQIARNNSEDPFVAEEGGLVEDVQEGQLPPALDTAVFGETKAGDVHPELIETDQGYFIVKIIEKTTPEEGDEEGVATATIRQISFAKEAEEIQQVEPFFVDTGLTGEQLEDAAAVRDATTNFPAVSLTFNSEGRDIFAELTRNNINKQIAIYLDGEIMSAPVVNQEIPNGEAQITGDFTFEEAKALADRLDLGALPVNLTLISQQNVGPTLGQASIERSLFAGVLGLVLLSIFMIVYYRLPGLMGVAALVIYSLIVLAVFKLWPITLTLAGVAGFILSIGMAVDANVLIFERMKEELRAGKAVDMSVADGFKRAWTSIRDSNLSSLITCLILYWFGSSLIRGFAITLAIGIVVSMFSAITISRNLLAVVPVKNTWWYGVKRKKQ
jgi:protein-export membrane protein SecD